MISTDRLIFLIKEYIADNTLPKYTFRSAKDRYFQKQCYIRWTAKELIKELNKRNREPPISVLTEFVKKMKTFSTLNPLFNDIFKVSYELSFNILDVCRSAGWVE